MTGRKSCETVVVALTACERTIFLETVIRKANASTVTGNTTLQFVKEDLRPE